MTLIPVINNLKIKVRKLMNELDVSLVSFRSAGNKTLSLKSQTNKTTYVKIFCLFNFWLSTIIWILFGQVENDLFMPETFK